MIMMKIIMITMIKMIIKKNSNKSINNNTLGGVVLLKGELYYPMESLLLFTRKKINK